MDDDYSIAVLSSHLFLSVDPVPVTLFASSAPVLSAFSLPLYSFSVPSVSSPIPAYTSSLTLSPFSVDTLLYIPLPLPVHSSHNPDTTPFLISSHTHTLLAFLVSTLHSLPSLSHISHTAPLSSLLLAPSLSLSLLSAPSFSLFVSPFLFFLS